MRLAFAPALVVTALAAIPSFGQDAPAPAPQADRRAERRQREIDRAIEQLVQRLGLDEAQTATVTEVVRASAEQAAQVRADAERRAQAIEQEREAKIAGLLTPEQSATYRQVQAERDERRARAQRGRDEMAAREGGRGGAPGRVLGGRGERSGPEGRSRRTAATPAERADRRLEGAIRDLGLSEDERLVLEPRIREVVTLDADAGAAAEKERQALEALVQAPGEADAAALRTSMDALRAAREANQKRREALEAELRELVTVKQEAVLVLHRVLR